MAYIASLYAMKTSMERPQIILVKEKFILPLEKEPFFAAHSANKSIQLQDLIKKIKKCGCIFHIYYRMAYVSNLTPLLCLSKESFSSYPQESKWIYGHISYVMKPPKKPLNKAL